MKQRTSKKQYSCVGKTVGQENSHLSVLSQGLWPDSVSGGSSVCLRLQAIGCAGGLRGSGTAPGSSSQHLSPSSSCCLHCCQPGGSTKVSSYML